MEELRELADLVDEHGFTDFEFENKKIRVRLSKATLIAAQPAAGTGRFGTDQLPARLVAAQAQKNLADDGLKKVTSPIVGTFYSSPSPDKPSYVKEGNNVSPDTVVCIVEAMKLMNEIQAEISGEVVKIYVENGQPVEYGQPFFGIK